MLVSVLTVRGNLPLCISPCVILFFLLLFLWSPSYTIDAQSRLTYDKNKGIVYSRETASPQLSQDRPNKTKPITLSPSQPPSTYYTAGLKSYNHNDFITAELYFSYLDSTTSSPLYRFWLARTWRKLGKQKKFLEAMHSIAQDYPQSPVADDALFQLAYFYQKTSHFDKAVFLYQKIINEYPSGTLLTTNENLYNLCDKQIHIMHDKSNAALTALGYTERTLEHKYRRFQKEHSLSVSGTGTFETMTKIKELYAQVRNQQTANGFIQQVVQKYRMGIIIMGITALCNLLLSTMVFFRNKTLMQRMNTLFHHYENLQTPGIPS